MEQHCDAAFREKIQTTLRYGSAVLISKTSTSCSFQIEYHFFSIVCPLSEVGPEQLPCCCFRVHVWDTQVEKITFKLKTNYTLLELMLTTLAINAISCLQLHLNISLFLMAAFHETTPGKAKCNGMTWSVPTSRGGVHTHPVQSVLFFLNLCCDLQRNSLWETGKYVYQCLELDLPLRKDGRSRGNHQDRTSVLKPT